MVFKAKSEIGWKFYRCVGEKSEGTPRELKIEEGF